jgi:hypothetical protein
MFCSTNFVGPSHCLDTHFTVSCKRQQTRPEASFLGISSPFAPVPHHSLHRHPSPFRPLRGYQIWLGLLWLSHLLAVSAASAASGRPDLGFARCSLIWLGPLLAESSRSALWHSSLARPHRGGLIWFCRLVAAWPLG